jgi:hypothetical protein
MRCRTSRAEAVLQHATRELVREYRDDIERVAEILMKRKALDGAEVDAMLGLPPVQLDLHAAMRTWLEQFMRRPRQLPLDL